MDTPADVFEVPVPVEPADIDENGHVNNVTYVRWVQDVAVAHWRAAAPAADQAKLVWVVVRHEIDYRQAAFLSDVIAARTWVGTASRLRFARHTEIFRVPDGTVLARALTLWCPIDAATGKPAVVSQEVRARFSVAGGGERVDGKLGSVPSGTQPLVGAILGPTTAQVSGGSSACCSFWPARKPISCASLTAAKIACLNAAFVHRILLPGVG